ncbi:hypothetical protein Tsp_13779 [Trichinella spiralis]|uniref:hypothetical protein n=1 Tax=Trichinella spiralis TaxID=6334 RepID=UPI0001EFD86D|nr:hypothetical protein Tsp_13779 [Trichinella spiralis]
MRLCYCLAGSDTWPMIDIRFAVTPLTSSFGVAPFISLGIQFFTLKNVMSKCDGNLMCMRRQGLSRRDDSHMPGSARHLVRKPTSSADQNGPSGPSRGGSDGSPPRVISGQNREASHVG